MITFPTQELDLWEVVMRFCLERIEWKSGSVAEIAPYVNCAQFLWIRSGWGQLDLTTHTVAAKPHNLICLSSPCVMNVSEGIRGVSLELDWGLVPDTSGDCVPESFRRFLRWIRGNAASICFPHGSHAEVEWLLERALQVDRSRPELFWTSTRLMLDEFLLLSFRQWTSMESEKEKLNTTAKDVVEELRSYIDLYYCEPIGLGRLSDHAGYSPSYLSTVFHKITGQCVVEYITGKRIEHAKHLLATSRLKVVEIGLSSGFKDLAHFNRTFRRLVGTTPSEYRHENMAERPLAPPVDLLARPAGARPEPAKRGLRQFYVPVTAGSAPATTIAC